ncbi:uncharacterized protein [Antedon mediterranea]|uniref:uncharacterized protein n=1 Tax=Antedon mediterranea TaxID=105859 RepID=UPI003AF478D6
MASNVPREFLKSMNAPREIEVTKNENEKEDDDDNDDGNADDYDDDEPMSVNVTKTRTPGLRTVLFRTKTGTISAKMSDQPISIRCAQACLRLGYDACDYFRISRPLVEGSVPGCDIKNSIADNDVLLEYEIKFQNGAFIKVMDEVNYQQALDKCLQLKGNLAFYEQLVSAIKYGMKMTCDQCWLISGEVTFSNEDTGCDLVDASTRFNLYPERDELYSCFYCYIYSNQPQDTHSYYPASKILYLRKNNGTGYNYVGAETRCQSEFGGHLALPMEVYNASLNGVTMCLDKKFWFSHNMSGACCVEDYIDTCWSNILVGGKFKITNLEKKKLRKAFCSLSNIDLNQYPYPSHWVIAIRGEQKKSLTFKEASEKCRDIGGTIATKEQVNKAYLKGYFSPIRGWIAEERVVRSCSIVHGTTCEYIGLFEETTTTSAEYDAFCYVPPDGN